jgi:uncharacterized protein (TIGR00725 family)
VDTSSSPAEHAEPRRQVEVAVLGSASIREDDPRFDAARQLGGFLAAEGWTVVTGGYGGLMAAASRGARERGGNVVGLPMSAWATLAPNPWSSELRWADSYGVRLGHLLACDAVVALDGGIGTLSETAVVWAALQTEPHAPALVLVGTAWREVHAVLATRWLITRRDLDLPQLVADVHSVPATIRRALATPRQPPGPRG